jgi:uncharacterized MAPEG superfamily protein
MVGASYYEQLLFAAGKNTYNFSFYAVPVMWVLSMVPHFYAAYISAGGFKNSTPRGYLAEIQQKKEKTPTDHKYIRAEAAQQNGHENLPFFAAALLAGNYAKLPVKELNALAAAYLISRMLYNTIYVFNTSEKISNLRSVIYLVGIGINFTLFIKAGLALN